jgi:anti-anti-sigma factor
VGPQYRGGVPHASHSPDFNTAGLPLTVTAGRQGNRGEVVLVGELDHYVADEVTSAVESLVTEGVGHVVVDAGRLGFVDSAGLAALLRARATAIAAGATFGLSGVSASLGRTIDMSGLGGLLSSEE